MNVFATKKLDVQLTTINFTIKNAGLNVRGTFSDPTGEIIYNKNNELESINQSVKVESISTGIKRRDNHLKSKDYFYTQLLPEIQFETLSVSPIFNQNKYNAKVKITIKNTSKIINILITQIKIKDIITLTSNFKLNRIDFSVGGKSFTMDDEVTVNILCSGILK